MGANILILNLTRMGDLIQTTPLVRGLRQAEPDSRITMLANAKFAGILKFVEGIDEIVTFDVARFGSMGGKEEADVLEVYGYLDRLCVELNQRRFDRIINLSHSKLSAVLSLLISAPDVRGFLSTPRGERLIRDPWLVYFTSFLGYRKYNRFNLVDMYMRGAGVAPSPHTRLDLKLDDSARQAARRNMEQMGIGPDDMVVGLQAGASREDRRWSPQSFAMVGDHLAKSMGAKIILFGAASEKKLGDQVEAAMTAPAVNIIGKTDLAGLAGWVKNLDLLVTNDTGTMHIAAALGTPIVALFFVHARCEETGPYCADALVLQADISCAPCTHQTVCDHYSCLSRITPQDVIAASESILKKDPAPLAGPGLFKHVHLYKSGFHGDGGIEFVPLRLPPLGKEDIFAYLYRPLFAMALDKWETPGEIRFFPEMFGGEIDRLAERFTAPPAEDMAAWTGRAMEGADELSTLAKETSEAARSMKNASGGGALKAAADLIERLDGRIATLAATHVQVSPLAMVYRRRVENFEGDDPENLASQAVKAALWLEKTAKTFKAAVKLADEKLRGGFMA
ncbi:MAG: glycosyltransferase family 9 protein [Nitrospinae bacterium]|nr:glycosyltransferase family 9 protein [Nitrospinota bacterium]